MLAQPDKEVNGYLYDMQTYLEDNVEKYFEKFGDSARKLKKADTPFIDEARLPQGCADTGAATAATGTEGSVGNSSSENGACSGALEQGGATSATPTKEAGTGNPTNRPAASVTMTTMYAARLARPDLLRCVGHLAGYLTKWNPEEDRKLHRMMGYINSTLGYRQIGFIGDEPDQLKLSLYTDADFAGDRKDSKSTTGVFLALTGPHSFFPLGAVSKKQPVCSHSTVEAEVVAAYTAVRTEGVPALDIWEGILGRVPKMTVYEDNQATARIIEIGKFPTLRHVKRMHGVSIGWLHDAFRSGLFSLHDCHTSREAADIFTKHFTSKHRWQHALSLIGIIHDPSMLERLHLVDHAAVMSDVRCTAAVCSKQPGKGKRHSPALAARARQPLGMSYYGSTPGSASSGVSGAATAAPRPPDAGAGIRYATPWGNFVRAAHHAFTRPFDPASMAYMKANPQTMTAQGLIDKVHSVSGNNSFWNVDKLKVLIGAFKSISNPSKIVVNPIEIMCYHCIIISNSIKTKTPAHPPAHQPSKPIYICRYIYVRLV